MIFLFSYKLISYTKFNIQYMYNNNRSNSQGGSSSQGSHSGNRPPRRQFGKPTSFSTPDHKKSSAVASDRARFVFNKEVSEGYPTPKKTRAPKITESTFRAGNINLSNPHINPNLFQSPMMKTSSPDLFPQGPDVKIMPIGGASEVGMNLTAIECGDDIMIVDTGFGFGGGSKYPGVDNILPDVSYLEQNKHKIRGLVYTHAHLDHIGGAPYIIPKLGKNLQIYGMPLTLALLKNRLAEFNIDENLMAKVIDPDKSIKLGCFEVHFFRLNHSIPDCVGLFIKTPKGNIVYATDWKFDNTPFDGMLSDYAKIGNYGKEGVRIVLTDSLGILKPGYQISERVIGDSLVSIITKCKERVIVTAFSTTVSRLQFTVDACVKTNRKMALMGRSMIKNFKTCYEMGYIKVPAGLVMELSEVQKLPVHQQCILMTGSQGEDKAALARIARDDHDQIRLQAGDSVIFSSGPIPGNEGEIQDLIAMLSRKGVEVYRNKDFDLHVSGHACHEDLKLLFALTRPDYLMPIHGDHWMLNRVGELGAAVGIHPEHCLISENGRIIEMNSKEVRLTDQLVVNNYILVDGTSIGAVSESVLDERRQLSDEGALIVIVLLNKQKKVIDKPGIVSRGFIYMKSSTDMIEEIRTQTHKYLQNLNVDGNQEGFFATYRQHIKEFVADAVFQKTEKFPMIIPVVVQI
jgi:ribonuclease J